MIVSAFTRSCLAARRAKRERLRLEAEGWRYVEVWEAVRGYPFGQRVRAVRIAPGGEGVMFQVGPAAPLVARGPVVCERVPLCYGPPYPEGFPAE